MREGYVTMVLVEGVGWSGPLSFEGSTAMKVLENGNIEINGEEFAPESPTNMAYGECEKCGWFTVNNSFWVHNEFSGHACLTKAGKPRKGPIKGFMRPATALELFVSMQQEVSA